MATAPSPLQESKPRERDSRFLEYDEYIDQQLERARGQVKGVDLASVSLTLAAGVLAFLFAAALVDHWLVQGGLGFVGRLTMFLLFVGGAATYFVMAIWPLLARRVNPVFAAYSIEKNRPGLKNSLINFLMLRERDSNVHRAVYEIVEEQAAKSLSSFSVEAATDRTRLIHVLYALLAVVAVSALYTLFSPKNPFASAGRVIAPWANIPVPTRVEIGQVTPGDCESFHGRYVTVSAHVEGNRESEPVTLFYTTVDGQVVDRPLVMRRPNDDGDYVVELPDGLGLQQDLTYFVSAGDARSDTFRVRVLTAPAINISEVEYEYPAYTGLGSRRMERQGQISAIEGTKVTLRAKANHEIAAAHVDFECDGRRDLAMVSNGLDASVTFELKLTATGRGEHESYQLLFTDVDGHENSEPIRFKIETTADRPPEIAFDPPPPERDQQIQAGGATNFSIASLDPDFLLNHVAWVAEIERDGGSSGELAVRKELLAAPRGGRFRGGVLFDADQFNLVDGDRVTYWAVAEDNRAPTPNRVETRHYTLSVGSRVSQEERQDQLEQANEQARRDNASRQEGEQRDRAGDAAPQDGSSDSNPSDDQSPSGEPQDQQASDSGGNAARRSASRSTDETENEPQADEANQQPAQEPSEDQNGGEGDESDGQTPPSQATESTSSPSESGSPSTSESASDGSDSASGTESSEEGEAGESGAEGGESASEENSERLDPESDAGRAIDEINKYFDQQKDDQPRDETSEDASPSRGKTKAKSRQREPGQEAPHDQDAAQEAGAESEETPTNEDGVNRAPRRDPDAADQENEAPEDAGGANGSQDETTNTGSGENDTDANQGEAAPADETDERAGESGDSQGERDGTPNGKQPASRHEPESQPREESSSSGAADEASDAHEQQGDAGSPSDNSASPSDAGGQSDDPSESSTAPGEPNLDGHEDDTAARTETERNQGAPSAGGQTENPGETEAAQGSEGEAPPEGSETREHRGAEDAESQGVQEGELSPNDTQEPGEGEASEERDTPTDEVVDPSQGSQARKAKAKGSGGKAGNSSSKASKKKKAADRSETDEEHEGGDGARRERGAAGGGDGTEDHQGPSSVPGENQQARPRDLDDPSAEESPMSETENGEPQSAVNLDDPDKADKAEKNTRGGQGGQEMGGGSSGGGQRANQEGTGGTGENTAADEGGGQATEEGEGAISDAGGDRSPASRPTDDAESQGRGPGSRTQAGGSQAGGADQPSPDDDGEPMPGEGESAPSQPADEAEAPTEGDPSDAAAPSESGSRAGGRDESTGSRNPDAANSADVGAPPPTSEAVEDEANLDYTRRATDLALERLKNELKDGEPDPELLDRLKWTREEMEAFVNRWEAMKRAATREGVEGNRGRDDLDAALRSLGLRPRGTSLGSGRFSADAAQTLRENRRTQPPPEYIEQFRAYSTGVARGRQTP